MSGGAAANAARVEVLNAFVTAAADPHALMDIVTESADRADAARRLTARFGLGRIGAEAVLDMQLFRLTTVQRERIAEERDARARELRGDGT